MCSVNYFVLLIVWCPQPRNPLFDHSLCPSFHMVDATRARHSPFVDEHRRAHLKSSSKYEKTVVRVCPGYVHLSVRPPLTAVSTTHSTFCCSHPQEAICALLFKVEAVVPYSRGDLLSRVHEHGACDSEEYTDAGTLIQVTGLERRRMHAV